MSRFVIIILCFISLFACGEDKKATPAARPEIKPLDSSYYSDAGDSKFSSGEYESALENYHYAFYVGSKRNDLIYLKMCRTEIELEKYDEAIRYCRLARTDHSLADEADRLISAARLKKRDK